MILGIWPSLYGIRQRTYENPDPHRQLRTGASPPDRPPRTTIATRRAARREERNEAGRPNRADDRPQPGELRDRTPPPGRTWDARASRALGLMSAGVLIKLPRHAAPPPSTFGGACAYLLMQRAKRQNHPAARRFPSFPYRAVPININPPHGVSPTFEPDETLP